MLTLKIVRRLSNAFRKGKASPLIAFEILPET
jgi:hypothetical protein